jgi:hypothetical protein
MFAAGLVIFLKKGRVIAVPFLKLRPSVAYRLPIELHLLVALTRDLGAVLEESSLFFSLQADRVPPWD